MRMQLIMFAVLIIAVTALNPAELRAQGVITVRLSYKVVLNPADGNRPLKGDGTQMTDNDIDTAVTAMNNLSAAYFRGFRFKRVDAVTNVGGKNDTTGPSQYFGINFLTDPKSSQLKDQMEDAALSNTAYAWNSAAINIYINQGTGGGKCSFPTDGKSIIVVGVVSSSAGTTQLHEIGHYFSLCHTHGCNSGSGDDGVADTLTDSPFWTQDQIAGNNFSGRNYSQISAGEQQQVDNVMLNLMSYHGTTGGSAVPAGTAAMSRLTELQLDRWTDVARAERRQVCDGAALFVGANAGPYDGSSLYPIPTVERGAAQAALISGQRILMLRSGSYNERLTISTPMTLRATRTGPAIIGR